MTERVAVLIAGSGPAGLTAAIYAARAQLRPIVIEGEPSSTTDQPGGQLMLTTDIENFPGFENGIEGPELMGTMRRQALRFGAQILTAKVTRVEIEKSPFAVWVGEPSAPEPTYLVDALIVATGARSLMLGIPGEDRLLGYGVSTCATCDGFFFRGKEIAVVGGGDSAIEEALFLTRFATKVFLIHRRDRLRASKIMQDRAFAHEGIEILFTTRVLEARGDKTLSALLIEDVTGGAERELPVSGLFVAIGHEPNTSLFKGLIDLHDNGYVATGPGSYTSVEGVFACGDVQDHTYRQAITAAGSGAMAAIDAERWLESRGH